MSKKYCFYCEQYDPGRINPDGSDTPRKCTAGHDDALNKWWQDNGKKKPVDTDVYEMECFVLPKLDKLKMNVIASLVKLNGLLDGED